MKTIKVVVGIMSTLLVAALLIVLWKWPEISDKADRINLAVLSHSEKKEIKDLTLTDYVLAAYDESRGERLAEDRRQIVQGPLLAFDPVNVKDHAIITALRRARDERADHGGHDPTPPDQMMRATVEEANEAIAKNPKDSQAYCDRAIANHCDKNDDKASADFAKALTLNPRDADTYASRAFFDLALHDNAKALADIDRAIALAPKESLQLRRRAQIRLLISKDQATYDKAFQDLNQAISIDPEESELYIQRGRIYIDRPNANHESIRAAREDGSQAIALAPSIAYQPVAYDLRAEALFKLGEYAAAYCDWASADAAIGEADNAKKEFAKALSFDPKRAATYASRAVVAVSTLSDKDGECFSDIEHAITLNPNDPNLYVIRGNLLLFADRNKLENALESAYNNGTKALDLSPGLKEAYDLRAQAANLQEDYKKALLNYTAEIDSGLKDKHWTLADKTRAYKERSSVEAKLREWKEAAADLKIVAKLDPDDVSNLAECAQLNIRLSNNADAFKDASAAILSDPETKTSFFYRAKAAYNLGNYKQAKSDYSTSIASDPEDAQSYYERGLVEEKMKDKVAAKTDKQKAIKLGYKSSDCADPASHYHWNGGQFFCDE